MTGATLLLVDDHATFRARARALLEAVGFVVVGEAATGEEALMKRADCIRRSSWSTWSSPTSTALPCANASPKARHLPPSC